VAVIALFMALLPFGVRFVLRTLGRSGGHGVTRKWTYGWNVWGARDTKVYPKDSTRRIRFRVTPCRVLLHSVQVTEPDGRTVQMRDTARSSRYEIRVEGVLDPRWTAWFEGLAIGSDDSQTVISGPVADQAALHGLLNRIFDLGVVLISVRRLGAD
jgi:hypothetical protein